MSCLRNVLNENQSNCIEKYYLHDTLDLEEETKMDSETNHNKYFELSDYDMKITRDFEELFNEEKDNLHLNKQYGDKETENNNCNLIGENIRLSKFIMLIANLVNFIPLVRTISICKNDFKLDLKSNIIFEESKELKEFSINFLTVFLFLMNFIIGFLTIDKSWKLFFLLINNIYFFLMIGYIYSLKKYESND